MKSPRANSCSLSWLLVSDLLLKHLVIVAVGLTIGAFSRSAYAQALLYEVNSTGDGGLVGSSSICNDGTGHCTLRAAMEAANSHIGNDAIRFAIPTTEPGYNGLFWAINLPRALPSITEAVSIVGPGAHLLTVRRNAPERFRIFDVSAATPAVVTLSRMTISNGLMIGAGGGINNSGNATVNITGCTISGNSAAVGGGIGNASTTGNGGIVNVRESTIVGNSSSLSGGGVYVDMHARTNITNSTLAGNTAGTNGGGAAIFGGTDCILDITNSTISGNSADVGGGVRVGNQPVVHVRSSIIAANTGATSGPDVTGMFQPSGFNLIGKNEGAEANFPAGSPNASNDLVGTSALPVDPKLDTNGLRNNGGATQTIALLGSSPAIDKGTSIGLTGNLTTDQRGAGFARTFDHPSFANSTGGDGTDVGAFEVTGPLSVSWKVHGATAFGIDLPLAGNVGIECRSGGSNRDYQIVTTFPFTVVSVGSASVTSGSGSVASTTFSGAQVIVDLTAVNNAQRIILTLTAVSDGTTATNASIPMGVLLGDTTGNGAVTASDIGQTKSLSGQPIAATNFRADLTVSGSINASDIGLVKTTAGTSLPP
jgi:hypothetical protein